MIAAVLCPNFDAFLIIANSALKSRGDNEAQTMCQQSFDGVMHSYFTTLFLICMFMESYGCAANHVLLVFLELKR